MEKTPQPDFLRESLRAYWFAPPVALWRAVELRAVAAERLARPLLDLGCGDGLIAAALFEPGSVDAGIDPWRAQLLKAACSGVYHAVQQGDGQHLPYRDGCFAAAFSNSVLEHIPDVAPVLREVGRVLRRSDPAGGQFVFTVPSDAFRTLLYGYQARLLGGDVAAAEQYAAATDRWLAHHHYNTPEQWAALLRQGGMMLQKVRYYIPAPVEELWDRMNVRFGVGRRAPWTLLASPRLRGLGYQRLLARWVVDHFSRAWRPYYEMDVDAGQKGGGLLIVAQRVD